jgi:2-polyprenyl-3-methyl-5-hydroxy-6-metoxy-1,4-benzoquinol methylase
MHNKHKKKLSEITNPFFQDDSVWKKKFSFVPEIKGMDMIWQKVPTVGFVTVPLENLLARIWTKSGIKEIPIEETPHHKWIKDIIENRDDSNSQTIYRQYIKTYFPRENIELWMERTKKMILSINDKKNLHKFPLVVSLPIKKTSNEYIFIIYDGVHRASIAKALGEKKLQCHITKIKKIEYLKKYIKNMKKYIKNILKSVAPKPAIKMYKRFFRPFRINGDGERVHIDYRTPLAFEDMDMYQKSHIRRYEFAQKYVQNGMTCGDFACGTGYGTVMLAKNATKAIGADVDDRVIKEIQRRYSDKKNISFVNKNLLNLSYKNIFDVLVSFETIEHLKEKDIPKLFQIFHSAVKPMGTFIFSTPYIQIPTKEAVEQGFHLTFNINEEKINQWLTNAGFEKGQFFYQNYQTHDISKEIIPKDFIIGIAQKP